MGNVKQRRVIWGLKDTSTTLPVLPTWKQGLGLGKTNTERKQPAPHFSAYGCEGGVLVSRLVSVDICPTVFPPRAACMHTKRFNFGIGHTTYLSFFTQGDNYISEKGSAANNVDPLNDPFGYIINGRKNQDESFRQRHRLKLQKSEFDLVGR